MSTTLQLTPPLHRCPDEQASRLYAEYGDRIFRYCYGRLRSREEAEDAVQNTFLRVCTALRKGVVPQFEAPWLYKIAHNVCLSRQLGSSRRARVETPADLDTLGEGAAARTPDADELFGLEEALADMPANLRAPLLLREWQGLSYAEIAESLGVSHSAVETLIFRARRHLAQALTDSVKKGGRAIASIFNLRWAYDWIRGFAGGVGSAGLAAGVAGLAVVIGAGVALSVAVQSGPSAVPATSTRVAGAAARAAAPSGEASHRAAARSASTSRSVHRGGTDKTTDARDIHSSGGPGSSFATARGAPTAVSAPSSSAPAAAPAGTKAKPSATNQQPPAGHPAQKRPPAGSSSGSASSGSVPPVIPPLQVPAVPSVPAVPDPASVLPPVSVPVPPLPDPPAVDLPPLPPPPVSLPPVPPPPLPPIPPAPPLPPVQPLVPGGLLP